MIKSEIKRLQEIEKRYQNSADKLADTLLQSVVAHGQIKTALVTISTGKSKAVSITDESLLGAEFMRIKTEPNKTAIKEALESGQEVQGALIVENYSLNIKHSILNGYLRHWILDDNIEGFHRLNRNEKPKLLSPVFFKCMEDFVDRYENIAIAGPNYYSFCKTTDKVPAFNLNTRIYSCILIKNDLPYRWRGRYNEDTDLSLRALKDGFVTVLFNAFLAGKVTTMRMKGGNTEEVYAETNNRKEFAESLKNQHPDVVQVTWKFNRWHHQVNYKPFKKNKLIKKEGIKINSGINEYGMVLKEI
jgi:hypothetical protein